MALEQFDVRRIRDGVTYNTKVSELLAYADGSSEESGASRWRAGLFRAPNGTYFAVREESRRYFDQIAGRWADGGSVSLDVLDYAGSLKWCEALDANILVDFTELAAAPAAAPREETKAASRIAAEPDAGPASRPHPAISEAASGLTLNISGDQKSVLEMEAQRAGMSLDIYLLHCVEVSRSSHGASGGAEADCDECIEQALLEIELEEAANAAASQAAPEDQLEPLETALGASEGVGIITLTVAEETENEPVGREAAQVPQITPMTAEMLHHFHLTQRAAHARQAVNGETDLGRAAE